MSKDTGGPAFPAPAGVAHITEQGMSLRDYFAAQALGGMLSNPNYSGEDEKFVSAAYDLADEMLKAREK